MKASPKLRPTTCWVISDGRRGIENQALGLAEALGRITPLLIDTHIIEGSSLFKILTPGLQITLKAKPKSFKLPTPLPQIAIGCGRQAIAALIALRQSGVFTIYVQDPRIDPAYFDLVIAPAHDKISGANVIKIIGSPNRITQDTLSAAVKQFSDKLITLPAPRVAVLIGGKSKTHRHSRDIHTKHMQAMCALAEQGMSVMISTSRRTPKWVAKDYAQAGRDRQNVWYADGSGENPYFAFLGGADAILVTEDSTNMLTEACATGKSVFTLPMHGNAGKFANLYEALAEQCHMTEFAGSIDAQKYTPLDETARVAQIVLEQFKK